MTDELQRRADEINAESTAYALTLERARAAGAEHGLSAASWYFDGVFPQRDNTDLATYAAVLAGMQDGDPAILDTLPCAPLSGEWSGDPTPASVLAELGVDEDDDAADDYLSAYEDGFLTASYEEVERVARLQTAE